MESKLFSESKEEHKQSKVDVSCGDGGFLVEFDDVKKLTFVDEMHQTSLYLRQIPINKQDDPSSAGFGIGYGGLGYGGVGRGGLGLASTNEETKQSENISMGKSNDRLGLGYGGYGLGYGGWGVASTNEETKQPEPNVFLAVETEGDIKVNIKGNLHIANMTINEMEATILNHKAYKEITYSKNGKQYLQVDFAQVEDENAKVVKDNEFAQVEDENARLRKVVKDNEFAQVEDEKVVKDNEFAQVEDEDA